MVLDIVQVGNPVLRARARALSPNEIRSNTTRKLIDDMRETMHAAPGVGLASPQVGLPLQLAVIEDREEWLKDLTPEELTLRDRRPVPFHVIINPRIVDFSNDKAEFFEGCLSLSGFVAIVSRSRRVRVEYLDEDAEPKLIDASGWYARILQHEIDHLRGNIYIDRMLSRTFGSINNFKQFWQSKAIASVQEELDSTRAPARE